MRVAIAVALFIASVAEGSPRILPTPSAQPLAEIVSQAKSIHALEVESFGPKGVVFRSLAARKGKGAPPFLRLILNGNGSCDKLFKPGDTALCFVYDHYARLFVRGSWIVAAEPIGWRGETSWFCYTGWSDHSIVYVGTASRLRGHVAAILAGRETTLTARAPRRWDERGTPRLWRFKAGPKIDGFALSEVLGERSSLKLGIHDFWASGTAYFWDQEKEALGSAILAVLRKLDDPAVLRRDSSPYVRLVAAIAWPRDGVPVLRKLLPAHPHFLCHAADTIAALGPDAASLSPLILPLMRHPEERVRRVAKHLLRRMGKMPAPPDDAPADLGPSWDDLAGTDPLKADLAVWRFCTAWPRGVAFLARRLTPPPALAPERIAKLIERLDSDDFDTRQDAEKGLAKVAEAAAPLFSRAMGTASLDVRLRLQKLLDALDSPTSEQRRRGRALRVLEERGGKEARALLSRLAKGEAGLPWDEPAGALARLVKEGR